MACLKTWEYQPGHGRRMSKARLVITAVVIEGRSQGEVARSYGVSQGWVSRLVARYRAEGEAAFEPRSRRPKTSPTAIGEDTVELIIRLRKELAGQGLDAGPHTIAWPAATLTGLQAQLDAFTEVYNTRRPHRSLPHRATPATAYAARPKAVPGDRTADTHHRVRADIIDDTGTVTLRHAGRLYHIGVGRTHARTRVLLLVRDLDIRIINAATGELLRQLTLDTSRNYQPTGRSRPARPRKRSNPEP
jgi:transposase